MTPQAPASLLGRPMLARPALARPVLTRAVLTGAVLAAGVLAGCGSSAAAPVGHAGHASPSLATSADYAGGTLAVLVMGGSSATHNNFWQLFARPAANAPWTLATPLGVADNGGISVAPTSGKSLVAIIRPSQDLSFSPLSASVDNGAKWSQAGLLDSALASYPDALAAAPGGTLIALTRNGSVEVSAHAGAPWTRLATRRSLAASAAARSCGLAGLTAAAYSPSAAPLLGGTCTRAGQAGIFTFAGGSWQSVGPALPKGSAPGAEVLAMTRTATGDTALLLTGSGRTATLLAAWSAGNGQPWQLSAPHRLGGAQVHSAAFSGQAVGVLLSGGAAVSVTGPGASWRSLPALPAGTSALPPGAATLAAGTAGTFQALIAHGSQLSVWALPAGGTAWTRSQVINVAIPYGSSG